MKKCNNKIRKFTTGGKINTYVENPSTELTKNDIMMAQAAYEASQDPLVIGLNIASALMGTAGDMLLNAGTKNSGSKGYSDTFSNISPIEPGLLDTDNSIMERIKNLNITNPIKAANGGTIHIKPENRGKFTEYCGGKVTAECIARGKRSPNPKIRKRAIFAENAREWNKKALGGEVPVEVEGGEVAETPFGNILDFVGPDHNNGGIKTLLQPGTEIYSDRIKVGDKTMAERKKARERKESKFQKLSDKGDGVGKNTLNRVQAANYAEDVADRKIQNIISIIDDTKKDIQKMANGGEVDFNVALGDILGMAGNLYQSIAPYFNTQRSRATDTPNINPYEGFGEDALRANDQARATAQSLLDSQLQGLESSAVSARKTARNSATGINTQRALDLAIESNKNKSERDIYNNFASQLINLLSSRSALENQQDFYQMQGRGIQDIVNRQDKDAYFTQLGQDKVSMGKGIAQTGKSLNDIKERNTTENLLNALYQYTGIDSMSGTLVGKGNKDLAISLINNGKWKEVKNPKTGKPFDNLYEYQKYFNIK